MSLVVLLAVGVVILVLALPIGLMAVVVVAALAGKSSGRPGDAAGRGADAAGRFLILIPAHDEAGVVDTTVHSCLAVAYDRDRFQVCVIADNCTDGTAADAEAAGALVIVRHDPARRSKGFALDDFFGGRIGNPAIVPPDAFVLVDADTTVGPGLLAAFDRALRRGDDFVQGYYSVRNADASWRTRLLTYAFSLANGVWLLGLDRLGLSVGLKGNGMCFRAAALRRFPWRAHGLVEDMEFAWHLRLGGERVRFEPDARVFGEMVSRGGAGARSQRQRWESGRRALRSAFRRELWQSPRLSWGSKLAYGIDLDFPPLSRLLALLVLGSILLGVEIVLDPATGRWAAPAALLGGCWATLSLYAVSPIVALGLPVRYFLSFVYLPYYMLWKLSIALLKAPQRWVRTPREAA